MTDPQTAQHSGFAHHSLAGPASDRFEIVSAEQAAAANDPEHADLGKIPQQLRDAGVRRIVLVHGTFAGNDIAGIAREVARLSPSLADSLNEISKRWFDELVGEIGNYTESFADCLRNLINPPSLEPIAVTRFEWSGENHHLGRADAAIALVDEIVAGATQTGGRLLILAHSHGGNVVALTSQLLGASQSQRRKFFAITRMHYRSPLSGRIDLPAWQRAQQWTDQLDADQLIPIDAATFGTPLRYRWNLQTCPQLLHFVNHRPLSPDQPEKAQIPKSVQDVLEANGGDYIQQLGLAGTDFLPSVFAWRDWIVEHRLARLVEPGTRRRDVIKKLMLGRRVAADGTTLLVDYPENEAGWNQKLFGHGVYTCRQWIPFHLREIAKRFYGQQL